MEKEPGIYLAELVMAQGHGLRESETSNPRNPPVSTLRGYGYQFQGHCVVGLMP